VAVLDSADDAGPPLVEPAAKLDREFCRDDECVALARMIYGEARGEPWIGKVAVGWTARNRLLSERWPADYRGIVYQARQFSCFDPGVHRVAVERFPEADLELDREAVGSCFRAASLVMLGRVPDPTDGAHHYLARMLYESGIGPAWAYAPGVERVTIGGHIFLRGVR